MSKNVLVLGAGVYQIPLIDRAKRSGAHTIVASIEGDYPGFAIADECAYLDTRDKEGLLALAREKEVDAVVTACTDVCVPSLGYICDELGLPGVSYDAALLSSNKIEMKKAFAHEGVRTAEFSIVPLDSSIEDCEAICTQIGYPVIFKAIDSSGSRGIEVVDDPSMIKSAIETVRSVTKCDEFLIERFLKGIEFGMQAFVQNGKVLFVMLHGDYLFQGATAVPMGHYIPYGDDKLSRLASIEAEKAIKALEIDNCAVNVDGILCDGEVYIIEIGARAGATCLPELVSLQYGIDYYDAILQCSFGEKVTIPERRNTYVYAMILCPSNHGVVESIDCIPAVDEHIRYISLDVKKGDAIKEFHVGPDRIGQVVVEGSTPEEAEKLLFEALDAIRIRLTDGVYVQWASPIKN